MNWLYPEKDHKWEVGEEIVAEWQFDKGTAVYRSGRIKGGWSVDGTLGVILDFQSARIIAYVPYVKPEPPEKPQDCPFCGAKMKVYKNAYGDWIAICSHNDCMFRTPFCKTKEHAIKALNSVRVRK